MTEDNFRTKISIAAVWATCALLAIAVNTFFIGRNLRERPVKAAEPQVYTGKTGIGEVITAEPLPVKWLGQICYMVNVRIDGEVYELPDTDDRYEMGLRSDGVMVWRKIDPKKARKAAK